MGEIIAHQNVELSHHSTLQIIVDSMKHDLIMFVFYYLKTFLLNMTHLHVCKVGIIFEGKLLDLFFGTVNFVCLDTKVGKSSGNCSPINL